MTRRATAPPAVTLGALILLVAAGCTTATGGSPAASPDASSPDAASPVPPGHSVPGAPGATDRPDDPVTATSAPRPPAATTPGEPLGTLVSPQPGALDPHPVPARRLSATVEGARVIVRLDWVSGVAPCSALSGVGVSRTGDTFVLTIREGSSEMGVACIDIAMYKATLVDLGSLAAGSYTIRAEPGDAAPISVVVP